MTKKNSTKSRLIASILVLCLCLTSLIGTTFAWFTDEVTSSGNKIVSGSLKVDLELLDKTSGKWSSVKEKKDPIFTYENWEPGYVDAKILKVDNEGTLALKWKAKFASASALTELADVIDVYVLPYGVLSANDAESKVAYPAGRDLVAAGYTRVGTLAEFVNTIESTTYGELLKGESAYLGIALKMQESAGNKYQDMDLGGEFDIQIVATQLASENDSFGPDYDAGAEYDGEITNAVGFKAALAAGGSYKVMNDVALTETVEITEGTTVTLNLNGKKITGSVDRTVSNGLIINRGSLTIYGENSVIDNSVEYGGAVILNTGDLVLNGGTYIGGVSVPAEGKYASYAVNVNNNGTLTVNNATIKGRGAIGATNGATVEINGGLYEATTEGDSAHVIYVAQGGKVIINDGAFNHTRQNAGANGDVLVYVTKGDGSSAIINSGTFDAVKAAIAYNGMNVTITGGTFKNTAANVYSGSLDTLIADGFKAVENNGNYVVVADNIDNVVVNAADMAAAIANGGTVAVMADIDMANSWTAVKPTKALTILGNGKTITNMNQPLLAGNVSTQVTIIGLTVADSAVAPAANENGLGGAAFVPYVDAYGNVTLEDCHLINSSVRSNFRAGGLVGYSSGQTLTIKNCTVEGCQITGVDGAGGLVALSQSINTFENSSVKDSKMTATEDRGGSTPVAGGVIGTVNGETTPTTLTNVTVSGNTVSNNNAKPVFNDCIGRWVAGDLTIDGVVAVKTADQLYKAVINGGATKVLLASGEYDMPNFGGGKVNGVTFTGASREGVVIKLYNAPNGGDFCLADSTATLENMTIVTEIKDWAGFQNAKDLTFNECSFVNNLFLTGNATFNKCHFTVTTNHYNVWAYSANSRNYTAEFNYCVFDCAGKSIYIDGNAGGTTTMNFTGCTFNDNGGGANDKAAIETGTTYGGGATYNVNITECGFNGFAVNPNGANTNSIIWANKNSMSADKLNIIIDGTEVY